MSTPAPITADQITIAVTVFSRRQYVKQAIASALNQTVPVRVIVVEDCGPDEGMREFITGEFGSRIEYFRNPKRRGLFDNWNACLECCRTPWLSILHDDDYLDPKFAESMVELNRHRPGAGLYFGHTQIVDEHNQPLPQWTLPVPPVPWREVRLEDMVWVTPFPFAGQLFRVDCARALGGFRATSQYCGDWEMWARIIANNGGARTRALVAFTRQHQGVDRGTNRIVREGRQSALSIVQHKRILHMLRRSGEQVGFDRRGYLGRFQVPTRLLLEFGSGFKPRLLKYNVRLLLLSPSPHFVYALFKCCVAVFGPGFVRVLSVLWNQVRRIFKS